MGYSSLKELFTASADAIREKTGRNESIVANDIPAAIKGISGGGGDNFPIGDGNTHIWIRLEEGRTTPMLGVYLDGTVTVDWGDGSDVETLTGTSIYTVSYTNPHNYPKAGDYVVTLTLVDGTMKYYGANTSPAGILCSSSKNNDPANQVYKTAVKRVEFGRAADKISAGSFAKAVGLTSVYIPYGVTEISEYAFYDCHALTKIDIPNGVTNIGRSAFYNVGLSSVVIPPSVTFIDQQAFNYSYGIAYFDFTKHTSVPTLGASGLMQYLPATCEIRVPAALVDEWKAATNWATYADNVVGV